MMVSSAASVLRELRIGTGLSQEGLAAESAVSVRTIRALERGQIAGPRQSTLLAIAGPLGLVGNDLRTFLHVWRASDREPVSLAELLQREHVAGAFLEALAAQHERLRDVMMVCETVIDADGLQAQVTITRTCEALADGVERVLWIEDAACLDSSGIQVVGETNCRAGPTVSLGGAALGHEMVLDLQPQAGQLFMITYASDYRAAHRDSGPARRETEAITATRPGTVLHVEQVKFTPPCLPARIWQVSQRSLVRQDPPGPSVQLGPGHVAQTVIERPRSGAHGLRWTW